MSSISNLHKWQTPSERFINCSLCSVKIALLISFHWNCFSLLLHGVSVDDLQIDCHSKSWLNWVSHFTWHLGLNVLSKRRLCMSLSFNFVGSIYFSSQCIFNSDVILTLWVVVICVSWVFKISIQSFGTLFLILVYCRRQFVLSINLFCIILSWVKVLLSISQMSRIVLILLLLKFV